jgi:hypothetical protein
MKIAQSPHFQSVDRSDVRRPCRRPRRGAARAVPVAPRAEPNVGMIGTLWNLK